jgi:1,4-dihydroxy-2-naphthoyl-CoA hydrolase
MKFRTTDLQEINKLNRNTLMEVLAMECVEVNDGGLKIRMPVDRRTHQPMGLLHGGASAALIESIGSLGSALILDLDKEAPVGVEINANHLSGVRSGFVIADGKLVHCGKRTHVWQVDIYCEETNAHVCTGRLTVMVIQKQ